MPFPAPNYKNGSSSSPRPKHSISSSFDAIDDTTYDPDGLPYPHHNTNASSSSSSLSNQGNATPTVFSTAKNKLSSLFSSPLHRNNRNSSVNSPNFNSSRSSGNNTPLNSRPQSQQDGASFYHNFGTTYEQGEQSPTIDVNRKVAYDDLTAIDWQYEYTKERLRLDKVDQKPGIYGSLLRFLDTSHIWIVLLLTGMIVALVSAFIDIVSRWLADVKFGYCVDAFYLPKDFCCSGINPSDECKAWSTWEHTFNLESKTAGSYAIAYAFYVFFAILFAAAACILVMFYAPHSRFSGITEIKTILSGFIIRGLLGFKTLVFKAIGLILVVGAGLWVGKEGPLVHVACCCAAVSMRLFPQLNNNEAMKREVLAAASSAGISVAFGSPIGGVLFSLEQLTYYFPERTLWTSFVAAMAAAVTLQFLNPFRSGNLVLFQVIYDRLWHRFELVPFAIIGVLGGLYGALFNTLNIKIANWRRRNSWVSNRPVLEVVVVALVTGILTYPSVYARIPASISLSHLFQECSKEVPGNLCNNDRWLYSYFELTFTGLQGFFLTAYSFGINVPAGIIMPSMLSGALLGRAIGVLMNIWQVRHPQFFLFETCPPDTPCVTPGVYALVGAASTLCGVTNLTVSTVVIMFELTGALNYVIPIMTGVMVSKWVSDSFTRKGIYECWIKHMEYPFLDNHHDESIPDIAVASIMTKVEDITTIPADRVSIKSLKDLLANFQSRGFPITKTESSMTLVGFITRAELRNALKSIPFSSSDDTLCTFLSMSQFAQMHGGSTDGKNFFATYSDNTLEDEQEDNEPDFLGNNDSNSAARDQVEFENIMLELPPIDLRKYAELAPITLSWESSLQLAASMFRKLGLRFILFTNRGELKGMLTRKDVWQMLNSIETDPANVDLLSESSQYARGRLMDSIAYSLRGSEDEIGLLMDEED